MLRKTRTQLRIEAGNKAVLRELAKATTSPKRFEFKKMFAHTFGFKPQAPVFMQKTKGGLVFFLKEEDFNRFTGAGISKEGLTTSGLFFTRHSKSVKPKNLKGKVMIVKLPYEPVKDVSETIAHEKAHLKYAYQHPASNFYPRKSGLGYRKFLEHDLMDELRARFASGYLDLETTQSVLNDLADKHAHNLVSARLAKSPNSTKIEKRFADKYKTQVKQIASKIKKGRYYKYYAGISEEKIRQVVDKSSWRTLAKNLEEFIRKRKLSTDAFYKKQDKAGEERRRLREEHEAEKRKAEQAKAQSENQAV